MFKNIPWFSALFLSSWVYAGVTYNRLVNAYQSPQLSKNIDVKTLTAGSFAGTCLTVRNNDPARTDTGISEESVMVDGRELFATTLLLIDAPKTISNLPSVEARPARPRNTLGGFICSNGFKHFLDVRAPYEKNRSPLECFSVFSHLRNDDTKRMEPIGIKSPLPLAEENITFDTSQTITHTRRFEIEDLVNGNPAAIGSLAMEKIYRYRASSLRVGTPGAVHAGTTIKQEFYLRELITEKGKPRHLVAYVTDDLYHCPDGMSKTIPQSRLTSNYMCYFKIGK